MSGNLAIKGVIEYQERRGDEYQNIEEAKRSMNPEDALDTSYCQPPINWGNYSKWKVTFPLYLLITGSLYFAEVERTGFEPTKQGQSSRSAIQNTHS